MKRGMQEAFDAYWAVWRKYRRRSDSATKARAPFEKAIPRMLEHGIQPEQMADIARFHIERREGAGELKYIQLASTYLNGDVWAEDYADMMERDRRMREAQERRESNVLLMPKTALPDTHFSRRWERGEIKAGGQ